MGWTNSHLHEFEIAGKRYGQMGELEDRMLDASMLEEARFKLSDVLVQEVVSFLYTYDFGDNWRHTVLIESRMRVDESINAWPLCVAGQHACPPLRMWGDRAAIGTFLRPSAIRTTKSMSRCGAGTAVPLIRMADMLRELF